MRFAIVELDLTCDRPLPELQTGANESGLALILREQDRWVGFGMRKWPHSTVMPRDTLEHWIRKLVRTGKATAQPAPRSGSIGKQTHGRAVSIVVCTRDRPERLHRCLESLLQLRTSGSTAPDLLVIDNAPSDDRTRRCVAALAGVRYELEPRPGLDTARNRGLAAALGDIVAFVDDDVVVDERWLHGLISAMHEHPDAGGFTGLVLPLSLDTRAQILFEQRGGFRRGFRQRRFVQDSDENHLLPCSAGSIGAGCNMAFDRALLQSLGGFDEALDTGPTLPGGGDLDMFYRVLRTDRCIVYEPRCVVRHEHRRTIAQLRRQYWSWGLGLAAFVAKSRRTDPAMRTRFDRLIRWWLRDQARSMIRSLSRQHRALPVDMIIAELYGAVCGFFGGYARSRARLARLRHVHSQRREPDGHSGERGV